MLYPSLEALQQFLYTPASNIWPISPDLGNPSHSSTLTGGQVGNGGEACRCSCSLTLCLTYTLNVMSLPSLRTAKDRSTAYYQLANRNPLFLFVMRTVARW